MAEKAIRRIIIKIDRIKLLNHYQTGFANSGAFPLTDHFFYRIVDKDGTIYTASTSKKLEIDNLIKASVVDENAEFRGEKQIRLTRVSILDDKTVSKAEFLRLLKDE